MSDYEVSQVFADNLKRLLSERGLKQQDIVRALGFSKSTVSGWCSGLNIPRTPALSKLEKYLGVNTSDLLLKHQSTEELIQEMQGDHDAGLQAAREAMRSTYGGTHQTVQSFIADGKAVVHYYHPFTNVKSSGLVYALLSQLSNMDEDTLESVFSLISAYNRADDRARQVVDLTLAPFNPASLDDILAEDEANAGPMPDAETIALARQILQDKKAQDSSHVSNGDVGKKKKA